MSERKDMLHLAIPDYVRPGRPACGIDSEVTTFEIREKIQDVNCQWCTIWWANHQNNYPTRIVKKVISNDGYDFYATHWAVPEDSLLGHRPICGAQQSSNSYTYVDTEDMMLAVTCVHCRDILDGKKTMADAIAEGEASRQNMRQASKTEREAEIEANWESIREHLITAAANLFVDFFLENPEEVEEATESGPFVHYKEFGTSEGVCGWRREGDPRAGAGVTWFSLQVTCPECRKKLRRTFQ